METEAEGLIATITAYQVAEYEFGQFLSKNSKSLPIPMDMSEEYRKFGIAFRNIKRIVLYYMKTMPPFELLHFVVENNVLKTIRAEVISEIRGY